MKTWTWLEERRLTPVLSTFLGDLGQVTLPVMEWVLNVPDGHLSPEWSVRSCGVVEGYRGVVKSGG